MELFGLYDIQVFLQAIVYLIIFVFGFAISVPIGLTISEFENKCILYTDVSWKNATFFRYTTSSAALCNFPIGVAVFACIFYGLGMGIYNLYAVCKTKDPNVGFNMWVMPFILANSLISILMFVMACMVSVGLKQTCDRLIEGYNGLHTIKSCSDAQKVDWNKDGHTHVNGSHFYSFMKAAEGAAWISFLLWMFEVGLYVMRFIRIRRYRALDMGAPDPLAGSKTPQDLDNFAVANPSA